MDSVTFTIISGVVVVVIGLFIEYGYFQRRRHKSGNAQTIEDIDGPAKIIPSTINFNEEITSTDERVGDKSWPEAISKAVENFSILHKGKTVELNHTNTDERNAWLVIYVWTKSNDLSSYTLTINKSGEILNIKQNS